MSDFEAQIKFAQQFCRWGLAAFSRGYVWTFGDAFRDPRATFPYSAPHSFHERRLAVDPNLFSRERVYLQSLEDWQRTGLGQLWVDLGGTWGGNFVTRSRGDANHLSWGEER